MSYLALTHGVHGIFWYCWKETGDRTGTEGVGNHPTTLRVLADVIAEIKVFAPALLAPGNRIFQSEADDGRVHTILCGSEATGHFLVYVNGDFEPADATLHVPELAKAKWEPLFGGPSASVPGDKLQLKLPPLATDAFRVKAK